MSSYEGMKFRLNSDCNHEKREILAAGVFLCWFAHITSGSVVGINDTGIDDDAADHIADDGLRQQ